MQDAEEYHALEHQYEITLKMLEDERREVARLRESGERVRGELLGAKMECEKMARAGSEKDKLVLQIRTDLEARVARISELETLIGRLRAELGDGEQVANRIRSEMREAAERQQRAVIEVFTHIQIFIYLFTVRVHIFLH